MEEIAEYFGQGFLQMLSGAILLSTILALLGDGGVLNEAMRQFLCGICG